MKRFILYISMLFLTASMFGQTTNDRQVPFHVADSTTLFNASLIDGTLIFDEETNRLWRITQLGTGGLSLSTVTKVLIAEFGGGADGNGIYDGSGSLSAASTTVTGGNKDLSFVGIKDFLLSVNQNFDITSTTNQMRLYNTGSTPISLSANGTGDIELDAIGGGVRIQNLFYPNSDGTAGQAMTTDGLGNLSFSTISLDNIYTTDDTTTSKRTVYLVDTLRFDSGYFRVKSLNDLTTHKGFVFENRTDELFSIDNGGRFLFGEQTSNDVFLSGTRFAFLTSPSNGSVDISNAPQDGSNNTTASNTNLNFSTRNSSGNIARTQNIFVRNRNVTPGSEYGVMTIGDAIQTENSTGLNGRTVIANQNRHTSGAAAAVLEVENRDAGTTTGLLVDHWGSESAIAFGVLSPNPTQVWSWRLYNDFSFEHNYSQANSGDFQMRSSTSQNIFFMDASVNAIGINTGTPFSTGSYVFDVNGYAHFGTGTVDIDVGFGGGILIDAGANTNTPNFRVQNNNDNVYLEVTSSGGDGRVGIGTAAGTVDQYAILELESTTQAFLNVRLDTAQRNGIPTPVAGMEAYNTTTNLPTYYNGSQWVDVLSIPKIKSGTADSASFSGNPKTYTVTFSTAFDDSTYSPVITCETKNGTTFSPVVESLGASSFTINMGANDITDLISVRWVAIKNEEN